jgi:hypothetical protein
MNIRRFTKAENEPSDELLTALAKKYLRLETLETRHVDLLDFHDIAVWEIKAALKAAYEAGLAEKTKSPE